MRLRFGILGAGGAGRALGRRLHARPDAEVTAVFAPRPEQAAELAGELDARPVTSAEEIWAAGDVDAVLVTAPPHSHLAYIEAAARGGKHVFSEKPLATTVEDCDRAISAAQEHGVKLGVNQVARYFPRFRETKRLAESGAIGELRSVSVVRTGPLLSGMQEWRKTIKGCGGLLLEINVHEFDQMRWLAGDPESVYAAGTSTHETTEGEEVAFVTMRFPRGVVGSLHTSLGSRHAAFHVLLEGTTGSLRHDVASWTSPARLAYIAAGEDEVEVEVDDVDPAAEILGDFVSWVGGGDPPLVSAHDARMAVAMGLAARRSITSGEPQTL